MKTVALFSLLIVFLASCGGGKFDINDDEQVMEKLNTSERDGKFIYKDASSGTDVKFVIEIDGDEMKDTRYVGELELLSYEYEIKLGEVSDKGREIKVDNDYGKYYYSEDDKITFVTDEKSYVCDFVKN